jgi:hypothetical protein
VVSVGVGVGLGGVGVGFGDVPPPPPHPASTIATTSTARLPVSHALARCFRAKNTSGTHAMIDARVKPQKFFCGLGLEAEVCGEVVTVTVKGTGTLPITFRFGVLKLQRAPAGAPVQSNESCPLNPFTAVALRL